MSNGVRIALLGAAAWTGLVSTASAQTEAGGDDGVVLEEIVVTATKQKEVLSRVPISVSAFTQEGLDRQSVRSFEDVTRLTPGVNFTRGTRGNSAASGVSIRGISSGAGSATVGVYIDETPVQIRPQGFASSNPYPRIFDLERVEILRGPQGTLFGAGSEGGTIRFITPDPSLTRRSVYARSELADTNGGDTSYELGAAMGGPIVEDKLGFRASAWYRRDGGFVDRVDWNDGKLLDRDADWRDAVVLRGALKWQATEALTLTPSVFYQETRINDSGVYWEAFSNPHENKFVNGNPVAAPNEDRFVLGALKAEWDLGVATLVSNTSYLDRVNRNIYDSTTLDMASFAGIRTISPPPELADAYSVGRLRDTQKVFTQEVRLQSEPGGRLEWVVGVFYQKSKQRALYTVENDFIDRELSYGFGRPVTIEQLFGFPMYQGEFLLYSDGRVTDEELSAFAHATLNVTDKLKLIAGLRASNNKYHNVTFGAGPVVSSNGRITESKQEASPFTPKFGVQYQADPNNMVYATVAKGYRQGSATGVSPSRCAADLAALGLTTDAREIKPDYVWSYEVGSKNRLLGGRVSVDASVYRVDWTNIQSGLTLPNCNVPITANLGDARSQGFDLTASARLSPNLTVNLAVGYADAKFTTSTLGAGGRVIRSKGQPLPIAPWTVAFGAQYEFEAAGRPAYARLDYQYASHDDTPLDLASAATDPTLPRAPASSNLDLRLGVKLDRIDLSVFAANVFDQHPQYGRYRDTLTTFNYRGVTVRPRTVGVTGVVRY